MRFGALELDLTSGELRRGDEKVQVSPKAFEVLKALLERPGEVVTREELRTRLWPADTFVEFDDSLNHAVKKLRQVLGDSATDPELIETLPRRGYRFICAVETGSAAAVVSSSIPAALTETHATEPQAQEHRSRKMLGIALAAAIVVLACAAGFTWYLTEPSPALRIASYTQITSDGQWKRVAGADGSNVYLNLFVPNGHGVVPVSGGRVAPLSIDLPTSKDSPNDNPQILGVSPAGSKLLVGSNWNPGSGRDLWIVDAHGGEARYLAKGYWATWSPDSGTVVYSTLHGDLYTIPSEGGEPRLLLASPAPPGRPLEVKGLVWSPDGSRIRFVRDERYWEVSAEGKNPHEILPAWHASNPRFFMSTGHWTPDGEFFLFIAGIIGFYQNPAAGNQIWALDERRSWLHRSHPEPFELTTGAIHWGGVGFAVSQDGKTIYPTGMMPRGELVEYDTKSKEMVPYLGGISAEGGSFSKDGRYLVYVTFPEGVMWRANRDGSGRLQLTKPPLYPVTPEWSPDGTQILFFDWSAQERGVMYTLSSQGGTPKRVLPGDKEWELFPDWSPDGKKIVFEQVPAGAGTTGSGTDFNIGANNRILELDTGRLSDLPPCPKFCVTPRWSPDGRYIFSMTYDNDLALFDFRTDKWSLFNLRSDSMVYPRWSPDSHSIYFGDYDYPGGFFKSGDPGIYRVPITGGKAEKVVDLTGFSSTGNLGGWIGLDPDGNLLLTRQAGTYDIFALALERK
jgi:DNA-binding winged helix-turn-helix (wHTH) protein/Tol biopolymer transport system component